MTLDIRLAASGDRSELIRMALEFFRASPYGHLSIDMDKTSQIVDEVLKSDDAVALLLVEGNKTVGCLVGCLSEMIFSREKIASEIVWWIDPEYRGRPIGFRMMGAFEWWAKKRGCTHVTMSLLQDAVGTRLGKIYQRKGYRNSEAAYIKELI